MAGRAPHGKTSGNHDRVLPTTFISSVYRLDASHMTITLNGMAWNSDSDLDRVNNNESSLQPIGT
jgi:hypothetical protein